MKIILDKQYEVGTKIIPRQAFLGFMYGRLCNCIYIDKMCVSLSIPTIDCTETLCSWCALCDIVFDSAFENFLN